MSIVRNLLDVSVVHCDAATIAYLTRCAELGAAATRNVHHTGRGWFLRVPARGGVEDSKDDCPPVLATIFSYARTLSCEYILFNGDASRSGGMIDPDPGLPTFFDDWSRVRYGDLRRLEPTNAPKNWRR